MYSLIGDEGNEIVFLRRDADVHDLGPDVDPPPQAIEHVSTLATEQHGAEVDVSCGIGGPPCREPARVGLAEEEDPPGEVVYTGGRVWHMDLDALGELEMMPGALALFEEAQAVGEGKARGCAGVVQRAGGEKLDVVLEAGVGVDDRAEAAADASEGEEGGAFEIGEDADDELGGQGEERGGDGEGHGGGLIDVKVNK